MTDMPPPPRMGSNPPPPPSSAGACGSLVQPGAGGTETAHGQTNDPGLE